MPASKEVPSADRPLLQRLLHAVAEVVLSLIMAGGLWMFIGALLCLGKYRCNNMGGIFFLLVSAFITMIIWSGFMSLWGRYRYRPIARRNLDVAAALLTMVAWIGYFLII